MFCKATDLIKSHLWELLKKHIDKIHTCAHQSPPSHPVLTQRAGEQQGHGGEGALHVRASLHQANQANSPDKCSTCQHKD